MKTNKFKTCYENNFFGINSFDKKINKKIDRRNSADKKSIVNFIDVQCGYTLIEVLITISLSAIVIGIIFGMMGPLHQGIVKDQATQKTNLSLELQTQVLTHSLMNAQMLKSFQAPQSQYDTGLLEWENERGDLKSITWNQEKLEGDFEISELEKAEITCEPIEECVEGTTNGLNIHIHFKSKNKVRNANIVWRP